MIGNTIAQLPMSARKPMQSRYVPSLRKTQQSVFPLVAVWVMPDSPLNLAASKLCVYAPVGVTVSRYVAPAGGVPLVVMVRLPPAASVAD
jgi:hypothetical protein